MDNLIECGCCNEMFPAGALGSGEIVRLGFLAYYTIDACPACLGAWEEEADHEEDEDA